MRCVVERRRRARRRTARIVRPVGRRVQRRRRDADVRLLQRGAHRSRCGIGREDVRRRVAVAHRTLNRAAAGDVDRLVTTRRRADVAVVLPLVGPADIDGSDAVCRRLERRAAAGAVVAVDPDVVDLQGRRTVGIDAVTRAGCIVDEEPVAVDVVDRSGDRPPVDRLLELLQDLPVRRVAGRDDDPTRVRRGPGVRRALR